MQPEEGIFFACDRVRAGVVDVAAADPLIMFTPTGERATVYNFDGDVLFDLGERKGLPGRFICKGRTGWMATDDARIAASTFNPGMVPAHLSRPVVGSEIETALWAMAAATARGEDPTALPEVQAAIVGD